MTRPRDLDALLAAYLDDGMTVLPDRVADAVLGEVHRTPQRPVVRPWTRRIAFTTMLSAAAVVALLVVGGALLGQRPGPDISAPSPGPQASGGPSQSAEVTATPTPTPTPTAEILGLDLTWRKVDIVSGSGQIAWLDDRFVLVDAAGAVNTSADGVTWQVLQPGEFDPGYADLLRERASLVTWEDRIVGWYNPEDGRDFAGKPPITERDILRVSGPGDTTVTTPFKGRIESIGVGPQGIVAQVHSDLDTDAWVTKKLGLRTNNDWTCCVKDVTFQNGVLQIKLNNHPGLKVVWADEGFEPGDFQDAGFGWYSPDGEQWTAIPGDIDPSSDSGARLAFPTGLGDVVGVSDGFIALGTERGDSCESDGGCEGIWHSADGLTWRHLANVPASDGRLMPWKGGALVTDGIGRFDLWTSQGSTTWPMVAEVPAPPQQDVVLLATGPLGLVSVRMDRMEILVTRDGVDWEIQAMPAAMVTDSDRGPTIAVGDRSVLYLTWSGQFGAGEEHIPSLWVGSVEP